MSIIHGEFTHFRHIKTRKVVVLEVEIPEEAFQDTISKLGMPIGGESKPVAVALLANKTPIIDSCNISPEGERLRTRAIMLCKDVNFWSYITFLYDYTTEELNNPEILATNEIYRMCNITSRSELATNVGAQESFKNILSLFITWKIENQYKDNLKR